MVAGVNQQGVLGQPELFQRLANPPQVLVKAVDATEVIRVFLAPIALRPFQVTRHDKIPELYFRSVGSLVMLMVVLVMRFDVGNKQKERFILTRPALEVLDDPVGLGINPVAACGKFTFVTVPVVHVPVIPVRGVFQHIGGEPVIVSAPALDRHR